MLQSRSEKFKAGCDMATVTASILVGVTHQNHGGILPAHHLLLAENDRPAWRLFAMRSAESATVWVPTVEDMLEDGLLMVGLLAHQDRELMAAAATAFRHAYTGQVAMYDDIEESERRRLYALCRTIGRGTKLVVTVLEDSSLAGQLAVLRHYPFDVEVCPSAYRREYAPWTKTVQERGLLPGSRQDG
jgi:hypothetical protein